MSRLALSDTDKQARDWFVETTKSLGCSVTIDTMGNTFAVRPGRRSDVAPIFAGSHLDTQPAAGRYDGILGIHAGVEVRHWEQKKSRLSISLSPSKDTDISVLRKADHDVFRC